MSVILKNSVDMSRSQLNTSKTKQTYSFPKGERFTKRRDIYCDNLYDLPSTRSRRAAGIGYGDRSQEQRDLTPGPTHYQQVLNTTSDSLNKKKGWTMGVSRERTDSAHKQVSPGPGQFIPQSTLSKIAFTIQGKPKKVEANITEPGPGSYDGLPLINPDGKYILSKLRSSPKVVISPSSSRFPKPSTEKIPGPGDYDHQSHTNLSAVGQYFVSNLHNSKCRTFGKAAVRTNSAEQSLVGPGAYQLSSEFGIYAKKN